MPRATATNWLARRTSARSAQHTKKPRSKWFYQRNRADGEVLSAKRARRFRRTLGSAININRGTNKMIFADQGDEVNISIDKLALLQTPAILAPGGWAVRSLVETSRQGTKNAPAAAVHQILCSRDGDQRGETARKRAARDRSRFEGSVFSIAVRGRIRSRANHCQKHQPGCDEGV